MFERAIAGDVAAAKLMLDRLTDVELIKIDAQNLSHEERVAARRAILNEAAARPAARRGARGEGGAWDKRERKSEGLAG